MVRVAFLGRMPTTRFNRALNPKVSDCVQAHTNNIVTNDYKQQAHYWLQFLPTYDSLQQTSRRTG